VQGNLDGGELYAACDEAPAEGHYQDLSLRRSDDKDRAWSGHCGLAGEAEG
jgi:hypothetical protein